MGKFTTEWRWGDQWYLYDLSKKKLEFIKRTTAQIFFLLQPKYWRNKWFQGPMLQKSNKNVLHNTCHFDLNGNIKIKVASIM